MLVNTHVLIVDDHLDELRLLVDALRRTRCKISVALDGAQGYHRALAVAPDLIIMDVMMPRMGGFAACRLLAADPSTCHIPVIFLSAASDLDRRLEGLDVGAVDYVIKPFEPAEVVARVKAHLRKLKRQTQDSLAGLGSTTDQALVRAAIQYLSSHLHDPPTLEELAKFFGTNEKRLVRVFREGLGKTPFGYLREKRLEVSKRLLIQTSLPIGDIADEVGFNSAANFATAFREHFGQTPTMYRETNQAGLISGKVDEGVNVGGNV